ncbi:hypothetical protein [Paraburkholderia rhizosphaerae]|uniref:Uncharacterized protein n=1 Tax=Paraburkholderia rhizosphaerae TaxID=480658 RepID=A0A4R8LQK1_9BURK|nr:hypothetical protein [Paraburkholderia rhizosphaerae]TDY47624.1 hypothetical protein BX592_1129 [Paraburkholderia rhizosphaerae]
MSDDQVRWESVDYEGFEIHVSTRPKELVRPGDTSPARYTYIGYVCHPGANPALPGHTVPFHADGEDVFATPRDAHDEAVQVGRSVVDGTHPDLSVLSLVTSGV